MAKTFVNESGHTDCAWCGKPATHGIFGAKGLLELACGSHAVTKPQRYGLDWRKASRPLSVDFAKIELTDEEWASFASRTSIKS